MSVELFLSTSNGSHKSTEGFIITTPPATSTNSTIEQITYFIKNFQRSDVACSCRNGAYHYNRKNSGR